MRQHEPQAMTFIEMLPVHVDSHINTEKVKAKESEKARLPNKAPQKNLDWSSCLRLLPGSLTISVWSKYFVSSFSLALAFLVLVLRVPAILT